MTGTRTPRPLDRHLFAVLSLIPDDCVWIDEDTLTQEAATFQGMQIRSGQISGIRNLRRHGLVVVERKTNGPDRWTRTPKGSAALAAHIRKPARS